MVTLTFTFVKIRQITGNVVETRISPKANNKPAVNVSVTHSKVSNVIFSFAFLHAYLMYSSDNTVWHFETIDLINAQKLAPL